MMYSFVREYSCPEEEGQNMGWLDLDGLGQGRKQLRLDIDKVKSSRSGRAGALGMRLQRRLRAWRLVADYPC